MIDLYCERLDPGLFAEPLNAATNLGFIFSGLWCWRRAPSTDIALRALAGLIVLIGAGSAMFHTFATQWAQWLDVIPILAFQLSFLAVYLARRTRMQRAHQLGLWLLFTGALLAGGLLPPWFNGSVAYVPAAGALLVIGWHARSAHGDTRALGAAVLFPVSLGARTVDLALCAHWPVGTHWLWHLLNAVVLALVVQVLPERRQRHA